MQTVFGFKKQQSQMFLEDGTRVPVTVVSIDHNVVTQHKTEEKEGYSAIQLGIGSAKKQSKPVTSHLKKANISSLPKFIREIRITTDEDLSTLSLGSTLNVSDILAPGDQIKVTGTSKGKGFAGGVKRYGFHGGPKTHGQSDRHRAPGSIGQGTTPGRVYKGKRMAGRMGSENVSVTNLYVIDVKGTDVYVAGLIPGTKNALVRLEKTGEKKNFVPVFRLEEPKEEIKPTEVVETVADAPVEEKVEEPKVQEAVEEVKTDSVRTVEDTVETPTDEEPKDEVKEEKENGGK